MIRLRLGEGCRNFLDFIKDEQGIIGRYRMAAVQLDSLHDPLNAQISGKEVCHDLVMVEVDIDGILYSCAPNSFINQVFPTCRAPSMMNGFLRGLSFHCLNTVSPDRDIPDSIGNGQLHFYQR